MDSGNPPKTWAMAVSISIHDGSASEQPNHTVHMLTCSDSLQYQEVAQDRMAALMHLLEEFGGLEPYKIEQPREGKILYEYQEPTVQ